MDLTLIWSNWRSPQFAKESELVCKLTQIGILRVDKGAVSLQPSRSEKGCISLGTLTPKFAQNSEAFCADPRNCRKFKNANVLQILDREDAGVGQGAACAKG
jgi:hypothetical protein